MKLQLLVLLASFASVSANSTETWLAKRSALIDSCSPQIRIFNT